jgi:hypothetical protein
VLGWERISKLKEQLNTKALHLALLTRSKWWWQGEGLAWEGEIRRKWWGRLPDILLVRILGFILRTWEPSGGFSEE